MRGSQGGGREEGERWEGGKPAAREIKAVNYYEAIPKTGSDLWPSNRSCLISP